MSITPISVTQPKVRKEYHAGEKDVKTPNFYCRSCENNCDKHCSFYDRPVDPNYNRCFNHTFYHPIAIRFKAPSNLEEIVQKEEELKKVS